MKRLLPLFLLCSVVFGFSTPPASAQSGIRLVLTGSRVTESFVPNGSSDVLEPGGLATYSLIIENDQGYPQAVDASVTLPPGQLFLPETLRINGLPTQATTLDEGWRVGWRELTVPALQTAGPGNLAGIHVFLTRNPSLEEIEQRLAWAAALVGPGGTIKLFLSGINERWTEPPDWLVYAVQRCYQLGMQPVIRLGFANGDTSSFTRRSYDPVGQMNRSDAIGGYWNIGWATRMVVANLLAATADAALAAPNAELTVIIGNEPNLEWVERDWFIDYAYVRQPDGSFDHNWLTTDPLDPTAAANSPTGWRRFVRGIPGPNDTQPTYETRLDDYIYYLGYDAAVEYGRFLRTTSGLLRELQSPRLQIAAGAIASGGGAIDGSYAYHQRHFIRRMLRTIPDALEHIDLWTTNNYPYTVPPWNNYHAHPADFDRYPLGEPFWHTEIGIDSYQGDLDYLAYLQRQGVATTVPQRAIIGEVNYGVGPGWGTEFGYTPLTEDLRAQYMSDIFETYYNNWRNELAGVNLWQLGDPDHDQSYYHMFDFVFTDSQSIAGWPTHRHLVFDAVAARPSRPGPGRLIITFQARLDTGIAPGPAVAAASVEPGGLLASYQLAVGGSFQSPQPPEAPQPPQAPQPQPPDVPLPPEAPQPPQAPQPQPPDVPLPPEAPQPPEVPQPQPPDVPLPIVP